MRTDPAVPRLTLPSGPQPRSSANRIRAFRISTEEFEKHVVSLRPSMQEFARRIFPKDPTGRWMTAEKMSLMAFTKMMTPQEQKTFGRKIAQHQMYVTKEMDAAGRFTPVPSEETPRPGPEGHRPPSASHEAGPSAVAEDAGLHPPHAPQEAGPSGAAKDADPLPSPGPQSPAPQRTAQDPSPASSGKAGAKAESAPPKPKATLADLLAADGPSQRPVFAEQAKTYEYVVGEEFRPGQFIPGPMHNVNFERKGPPGPWPPTGNTETAEGSPNSGSTGPKREARNQESGSVRTEAGPSRSEIEPEPEIVPVEQESASAGHESGPVRPGTAPAGHGDAPEERENAPARRNGFLQHLKGFIMSPMGAATAAATGMAALMGLTLLGGGSSSDDQNTPNIQV